MNEVYIDFFRSIFHYVNVEHWRLQNKSKQWSIASPLPQYEAM